MDKIEKKRFLSNRTPRVASTIFLKCYQISKHDPCKRCARLIQWNPIQTLHFICFINSCLVSIKHPYTWINYKQKCQQNKNKHHIKFQTNQGLFFLFKKSQIKDLKAYYFKKVAHSYILPQITPHPPPKKRRKQKEAFCW